MLNTPFNMGLRTQNFLFLIFLTTSSAHTSTSGITNQDQFVKSFFLCLSSGNLNYITPSPPASFQKIFSVDAYNLRVTKSSIKPIAIILPQTKRQLASAIVCCAKATSSFTFTIRSGGHSNEGLSYSSAGNRPYVIIDLMKLHQVSVDLESKTAWVEAGATLGEIYYAVAKSSNRLAFPAGVCPTVGSGGHISGGGYGLLSRMYGLAADYVEDAILIDAEGRWLDCKTMGEDVFWAIRGGGGGSFGAVYSWKIQLVDVPETVTIFRITRNGTITKTAQLLDKWQVVAPFLDDSFTLMVTSVSAEPETRTFSTGLDGLYLGPKASALARISHSYPELDLVASECTEMSWVESMAYFAGYGSEGFDTLNDRFATSNQKSYYKWKGDYVREKISLKGIEGILDMLMEEPKGELRLYPLGGMMARIENDAIPFPHRKGNIYEIAYHVSWDEEDDKNCDVYMDWIRRLHEHLTVFVSNTPRAAYVNELDLDFGVMDWDDHNISSDEFVELGRVWGEKYFLGNYDRLVRAKTLVDEGNVFRHQQSIPPKPCIVDSRDDGRKQFLSME